MKIIIAVLISLLILFSCTEKKSDPLLGTWIINFDETLKSIESSTAWSEMSPEEQELIPETLMETVKYMAMEFTGEKIVTHTGNFQTENPYIVKSEKENEMILEARTEDTGVLLTIVFLEKGLIRITSANAAEMDYYIWEREL